MSISNPNPDVSHMFNHAITPLIGGALTAAFYVGVRGNNLNESLMRGGVVALTALASQQVVNKVLEPILGNEGNIVDVENYLIEPALTGLATAQVEMFRNNNKVSGLAAIRDQTELGVVGAVSSFIGLSLKQNVLDIKEE